MFLASTDFILTKIWLPKLFDFSFSLFKRPTPFVRQSEAAECGLACLTMMAGHHGANFSLSELRHKYSTSLRGATLQHLITISDDLNLATRALRCDLSDLRQVRLPAMLHWDLKHFVVLDKISSKGLVVLDPAVGKEIVTWEQASEKFTGVVLEAAPTKNFTKREPENRLKVRHLVPFSRLFWRSLFQALVLSLCLQFFVLLAPIFMQLVVDEAILKADVSLLIIIAISFSLLKVFEVLCQLTRSLVLQYLTTITDYDMQTGVMRHLFRLPLSYFQKRFIGDIQQRISALSTIQYMITNTTVSTVIDGTLTITIGLALFIYSPLLALITTLTIVVYALIRLLLIKLSTRLSMETMLTDAEKQSHFLESLRAIEVVKIAGLEQQRVAKWRNLLVAVLNSKVQFGNTDILFAATNAMLLGISNILVVYLAAKSAMAGAMTVGMIVAFLAYKGQFETKLMSLIDTVISFKMLDVNLERVSDIVLTEPESNDEKGIKHKLEGQVEIRNLSFAYDETEPTIMADVNLKIRAGEFIVFIGATGSGKTTLLKLIIGVLQPSTGEIIFDGITAPEIGSKMLRRQMGVMMQHDSLLSGTIEQNISLFDDQIDLEKVRRVAKLASIDDEIDAMPMGLHTFVGDMGTTLSGGQLQRLYLARALYRQPSILIMDEGTSNLDIDTEKKVSQSISAMGITRIMAAHRPETISSADRVFEVGDMGVREVTDDWVTS